jgi:lipoyl(octanoyl) transferase
VTETTTDLAVLDWGRTRYGDACAQQAQLVARRVAGEIGDTLVFTEHEPVYTVGLRSGAATHLLWDATRLATTGIEVAKTNRGGDITYHGPGQIVGYPVVDLSPRKDLHAYLRFLEQAMIDTVAAFGVTATRREGLTGIWIGTRKIAAIGVAVRRWVAYHGFALNVAPDLTHFSGIVPCGIAATEGTVTSLAEELRRPIASDEVKPILAGMFRRAWPRFIATPPLAD